MRDSEVRISMAVGGRGQRMLLLPLEFRMHQLESFSEMVLGFPDADFLSVSS